MVFSNWGIYFPKIQGHEVIRNETEILEDFWIIDINSLIKGLFFIAFFHCREI